MEAASAELFCCIHLCEAENDRFLFVSSKNFKKIKSCQQAWILLDGPEKSVADKLNTFPGFSGDGSEALCIQNKYAFHKKCYMQFTNVTKIDRAKKRMKKNEDVSLDCQYHKRYSRSKDRSRMGIFPHICVICEKEKYFTEKHTGKRKKEKLSLCQTFPSSKALLDSASRKCDTKLLRQIQDIDCIAKEVKYHHSCYKAYTRVADSYPSDALPSHPAAYSEFCKIVEERIIKNSEILSMNKLSKIFENFVLTLNYTDTYEVSNRQLKRWLQRDYPQLIFVKPKQRNLSELVLFHKNSDEPVVKLLNESSETEEEIDNIAEIIPPHDVFNNEANALLYKSSFILRNLIKESPPLQCSWPPIAEDLSESSVQKMIPIPLFNFLAWCVGATEDFNVDEFVKTSKNVEQKLLSISQDIIYLSSAGKKHTPKHLSLAMAVRHITGSSKIIELLNGLGHCISHSAVLEYDTGLAEMQLHSVDHLPLGIVPEQFATLVWDNIDFREETLTGHNTSHYTNGIIIQESNQNNGTNVPVIKLQKRSKKRTINPPLTPVSNYHIGKRCNPEVVSKITMCDGEKKNLKYAKQLDLLYIFLKHTTRDNQLLPGWSGFNSTLEEGKPLSIIRYLPVLEANPTDFSTVNNILLKSLELADKMHLKEIVLVFDEAIYAKAQQIRFKDKKISERLVIRLGEFHTTMTFLAILGKRFKDAGLSNILIESEIVAEGSVNGVLNGKHYNRSIRCHKIIFEALSRLLWDAFLNSMPKDEYTQSLEISNKIFDAYKAGVLKKNEIPQDFISLIDQLNEFVVKNCESNATFAFWMSYLDMVGCLLNFLRATRNADWFLHLAAIEEMIPWFFAYDRVNYARYLPIYLLEMLNLQFTHPFSHKELCSGNFVAQRQNMYGFSGTAMDQVIEQTANRDSKTKGGLISLTKKPGAVHRWMLSHHLRAQISHSCEQLAGKKPDESKKKDLYPAQIKKNENMVLNVQSTIMSMINPFTWQENALVNISSGVYASDLILTDLASAKNIGTAAFMKYSKERLHEGCNVDVHAPIKLQKLKTFSDACKKTSSKNTVQKGSLEQTTDLLARVIVMGQITSLDMKNVMTFNLNAFPPAIANPDGSLIKTNKATLVHAILDMVDKTITVNDLPCNNTLILDGMVILQQVQNIPNTFGELAIYIIKYIINMSISYKCRYVHFVTDNYPSISIKNSERERRSDGGEAVINIRSPCQKLPKQFKQFLTNGKNKETLVHFLYEQWSALDFMILKGQTVFISHGNMCHVIRPENKNVVVKEVPELTSDHEEADTRMFLHACYASEHSAAIIIKSSDTDVFVMALAMSQNVKAQIYLLLGTSSNIKIQNISQMSNILGIEFCSALLGMHVFTGCDTCSAFKGKGKIKPLNMMKNKQIYLKGFQELGLSLNVTDNLVENLETFVCELYGHPNIKKVDDVRYQIFKLKFKMDNVALPPNFDSLLCHIKRANYQAYIHRRCLANYVNAPSPSLHGWLIYDDKIIIQWNTIPIFPDFLKKHISCSCQKTSCLSNKCTCKVNNTFCSEYCSCNSCQNIQKELPENCTSEFDSDIDFAIDFDSDFDLESESNYSE